MYFTSLPDRTNPAFDEKLHFSKYRQHNIIFNAIGQKDYCERHVGCLSIKTVLRGEEWYGIDNRQLVIRPGQFLILNDNQEYSSRIDLDSNVNTLSVFFSNQFANAVFHDVSCGEEALLDNPFDTGVKPLEFFQTLNYTDSDLQRDLLALIAALDEFGYNVDMVDEHLVFLLHRLIRTQKKEIQRSNRVSAVKPITRTEIYKRLCVAKDFLHSTFTDKPDLAMVSNIACLSVPQLIRQFKAVFQTTPHQYLNNIRLEHASELLKHSAKPLNEITSIVGFEDTSAFCRAFRIQYGASPLRFWIMK